MKCIICHIDRTPLKILAIHIRCKKDLIAYHKSNNITTMKRHVECDHYALLKNLLKDATNLVTKSPLDCEPNKKKAHVSPFAIFSFFSTTRKLKTYDATQVGS
jgi:hypothetical protein